MIKEIIELEGVIKSMIKLRKIFYTVGSHLRKNTAASRRAIALIMIVLLSISSLIIIPHFYDRLASPKYGFRETVTYNFRLDGWAGYGFNMTFSGVHPEWIVRPVQFLPLTFIEENTYTETRELVEIIGSFIIGSENETIISLIIGYRDKVITVERFYLDTSMEVENATWFFYKRRSIDFQRNLASTIPPNIPITLSIHSEDNVSICLYTESYIRMRWLRATMSPLSVIILIVGISISIFPPIIAKIYSFISPSPMEEALKLLKEIREKLK